MCIVGNRHGSFSFLLEVFSLKNEGVIAVFPKIMFMTSRDRKFSENNVCDVT